MSEEPEGPLYTFGPRETRGILLGLRGGQLVLLGAAGFGALVVLRILPGSQGLLTALGMAILAAIACWVPLGRLTAEQWAPTILGYLWRGLLGRRRFQSRAYRQGHRPGRPPVGERPWSLRGLRIAAFGPEVTGGGELGVLEDRGARTYVGVLGVRGRSFSLVDRADQDRQVAAWSAIVAGLGRHGSPIRRLQWVERTIPEDREALARYLEEHRDPDADEEAVRSYRTLIEQATSTVQRHEGYLAVQLDLRRAWRQARLAGNRDLDLGAAIVLLQQLRDLEEWLRAADLAVSGPLTARQLAGAIRYAYDPGRRLIDAIRERQGGPEGPHPELMHPTWTAERWASYRSGPWWHATYYVEEWPRVEVGPDFLRPLILSESRYLRSVAMTLEPVPPLEADREIRRARVADETEEQLRARARQLTSARRRREQEHLLRTEQELADGHISVRFAGYVTVTAPSPEELDRAAAEVEQQAAQARLVLSRVYGDQELAFTYTLPICRGLP